MKKKVLLLIIIVMLAVCSAGVYAASHDEDNNNDLTKRKENTYEVSLDLSIDMNGLNGNQVLSVGGEGTNASSYPIKKSDEVYVTFTLPDNVKVDEDKVMDEDIYVDNDAVGIRIDVPAEEQFEFSSDIPIKGEWEESDENMGDFYLSYLNDQGELIENGTINYSIID